MQKLKYWLLLTEGEIMIIDEDKQVSDEHEGQDSLADENSETLKNEPENQSDSVS